MGYIGSSVSNQEGHAIYRLPEQDCLRCEPLHALSRPWVVKGTSYL